MALYLPIRAFNRSQAVRIGGQRVLPTATTYVDIGLASVRKELGYHSAIGAVYPVGAASASNSPVVVRQDAKVTTDSTDQTVDVPAGELWNRATGAYVSVVPNTNLAATAYGSLPRVDIVQVHTTTGVATYKAGTEAASGAVAPAPDAGNIAIASIARTDNTIAVGDITDIRPRP